MRYGLIIFIATTTDLLYLNCGLCVIDTEGLMYLSFTLHKIGHNNNHADADRDWKDLFELFSGVCYDISQKFLAAVNSASRIPMLKDVL
jgi:hypothetical protein